MNNPTIDTTTTTAVPDVLAPRTSHPKFSFCAGMNAWCGGGGGHTSKGNDDDDSTVPNTPDHLEREQQFFIDADLSEDSTATSTLARTDQDAFWNRFLSLLWILWASNYWKQQQEQAQPDKSAPPVLSERTADTVAMEDAAL